jgi:hypothetical protein
MILLAAQAAGRLGGGAAVDVPVGRIVVAFLICALIAFLAILLIRQRTGRGDLAGLLRRVTPGRGAVEIVEVRRLTMHADIGLVRHDGREYLLVLQAGSNTLLRERDVAPGEDPAL